MAEPLKNMYNAVFFDTFTSAFQAAYPDFDRAGFLARIHDSQWEARELKDRMRHISRRLGEFLPKDYRAALDIIRRAAPALDNFPFANIVFPDFVEVYGLDDWEASLSALELFTQQSSGEFAVRPFILKDPERMMAQMLAWAKHESHHVRRLASEGCRPRLPWAMALPQFKRDPSPILPILETLKQDESEYVRRSVANNLNDIAKDHPQVVIEVLQRWRSIDTPEIRWIIERALRTLIKQGHVEALSLLGFSSTPAFALKNLIITPESIAMGGELSISFELESQSDTPQNLVIDYVVYHKKANGQLTPKVFKLTKLELNAGESVRIQKRHSFRPITTRRYYSGEHALEIQVNGQACERRTFMLDAE
jgi:3-methyladenine DNA glycosylase AlkC